MKKVLFAFALGLVTMSAQARPYVEVGYGGTLYELDGVKASAGIMRGVFGYEINDNLAVEGMHGFGVRAGNLETDRYLFRDVKIKTEHLLGIYLAPKMKFSDNFEGFARIGAAHIKAKLETPFGDERDNQSGFSFGLGLRYRINNLLSVGTDYMSYYRKSGEKVHGLNLNVGFRF